MVGTRLSYTIEAVPDVVESVARLYRFIDPTIEVVNPGNGENHCGVIEVDLGAASRADAREKRPVMPMIVALLKDWETQGRLAELTAKTLDTTPRFESTDGHHQILSTLTLVKQNEDTRRREEKSSGGVFW